MLKKLLYIVMCAIIAAALLTSCGILSTTAQVDTQSNSLNEETTSESTPEPQEDQEVQDQSGAAQEEEDALALDCDCFEGTTLRIPQGEGEQLIAPALTTTLADIIEKGSLVIGIDENFAPFTYIDENGEYAGFDIDLATAVCNHLGVTPEFVPIHWLHKETLLNTGKIDCIWSGMSFTNDRQQDMSLTGAYFRNILTVKTAEDVIVSNIDDLVGLKIGVQEGSAAYNALLYSSVFSSVEEDIVLYSDYEAIFDDIMQGNIDCTVVDQHFYDYKVKQENIILNSSPMDFGDDFYVVGTRKSDSELNMQINAAITELRLNGVLTEISLEWFGTELYVV